ncbi:Smr-domain-containing protein [Lichtheimia hyalospora FSU 10163]|nr:Smr-domain-containing protein [Lichtheimia hyalospora FSU 10163]
MGRLQDNQYNSFTSRKDRNKTSQKQLDKNDLTAKFCPPLDSALVEAIWNDSQNYETCSAILAELAKDADSAQQDTLDSPSQVSDFTAVAAVEAQDAGLDDNLEFLMTCFPSLSVSTLSDTLHAQHDDLEKATDILLNDMFLETDSQGSDSLDHDSDTSDKKKKKKKKQPKTIWSTSHSFHPHKEQVDENNDRLATVPFNCWHQYDGKVKNIAQFFPNMPKPKILGSVQRCRGNIIASVRDLMKEQGPSARRSFSFSSLKQVETLEKSLVPMLEDRSREEIKQIATGVMVDTLIQQQEGTGRESALTNEKLVDAAVDFALKYDQQQYALEERLKQQENLRKAAAAAAAAQEIPVVPEYLRIDNGQSYVDDDPEECRNMAMQLIVNRNQLFMKAAESYRQTKNKGPGESGVAFYYSDEARKLDNRAREWNMRAARALVRHERIAQSDDHLLDLHGLTVEEARVLLKEGVTQWWSRSQMQIGRKGIRPLKIITGAGKHSAYGEAKLMPSALKLLKQDGWRYELPHPGCILVKGVNK